MYWFRSRNRWSRTGLLMLILVAAVVLLPLRGVPLVAQGPLDSDDGNSGNGATNNGVSDPAGICDRTAKVESAIMARFGNNTSCASVTDAQLNALTGELNLSFKSIAALQDGDFAELSGVTKIRLDYNSLTTLPADIFDGLTALEELWIYTNQINSLPTDVFDGLSNLRVLALDTNQLTTLQSGLFDNLTDLDTLGVSHNRIATLGADVFDDLTSLTRLKLNNNALTGIPYTTFDDTSSVKVLSLQQNQITSLTADIFNRMTNLTNLNLHNNQLAALPAGLLHGLSELDGIPLYGNPGAPFDLEVTLVDDGSGNVSLSVPLGAPFELNVLVAVGVSETDGGALSKSFVTIDAGSLSSEAIAVSPTSASQTDAVVRLVSAWFTSDVEEEEDDGDTGLEIALGNNLTIDVTGQPVVSANSPATGVPTISGTVDVGETLIASTSEITDVDGLTTVVFSYQWILNDGTADAHIAGATSATYSLKPGDSGNTVKVRVTFIDDAGHAESATSEASGTIAVSGLTWSPDR